MEDKTYQAAARVDGTSYDLTSRMQSEPPELSDGSAGGRCTILHEQVAGPVSRLPLHLRSGYTSHLRSSSRTSWDGRMPELATPAIQTQPHRARRRSAISLPDHGTLGRPTVLSGRWSYDHERMPSPPPGPLGSGPSTPISQEFAFPSSRPASTFIESESSSRPQSAIIDDPVDVSFSYTASTPTLKVIPPPPDSPADSSSPFQQPASLGRINRQRLRQDDDAYHILTSAELEMLSRPPPTSPPPSPRTGPVEEPLEAHAHQRRQRQSKTDNRRRSLSRLGNNGNSDSDFEADVKPGCLGLCELATGKMMVGKLGAWLMGTLIPITFGLVTGCIATATGCR
ncbi:hypothetical protein MMYC01_206568 [Madurella mycetomatis]|uniref:Uncharacterized protein n=1 Tax=Madurella mycetomatis TaxID=100816 RepID=A0A175VWN8_9PEZI|nr:hypothetical protein MMYC01_206568 [Madurella mycetomatis]